MLIFKFLKNKISILFPFSFLVTLCFFQHLYIYVYVCIIICIKYLSRVHKHLHLVKTIGNLISLKINSNYNDEFVYFICSYQLQTISKSQNVIFVAAVVVICVVCYSCCCSSCCNYNCCYYCCSCCHQTNCNNKLNAHTHI